MKMGTPLVATLTLSILGTTAFAKPLDRPPVRVLGTHRYNTGDWLQPGSGASVLLRGDRAQVERLAISASAVATRNQLTPTTRRPFWSRLRPHDYTLELKVSCPDRYKKGVLVGEVAATQWLNFVTGRVSKLAASTAPRAQVSRHVAAGAR